jgi:hypothetical protein
MQRIVTATAVLGLVLVTPAWTQSSGSEQRPASRSAGTADEAAAKFLQQTKQRQTEQKERLQAAGLNYGQFRSLVAKFKSAGPGRLKGLSPQTSNELSEAFIDEVALELATLGFRPPDFQDSARAAALFAAASDKLLLAADYADYKLLSKAVVRGKVAGYRLPDRGSAGAAIMRVDLLESYKGDIAAGTQISVLMRSGQDAAGNHLKYSDEAIPPPGTEIVLVLSQIPAGSRGGGRLKPPAEPEAYTKLVEPYSVEGVRARAYGGLTEDVGLSDL